MCVRVKVHPERIRERHSYLAKDIKRRRWTLSTQLEVANMVFATHCLAATAICSLPAASSTSPDLTLSLICLYESWQSGGDFGEGARASGIGFFVDGLFFFGFFGLLLLFFFFFFFFFWLFFDGGGGGGGGGVGGGGR